MKRKTSTAALISIMLAAALAFAACELGEAEVPQKNLVMPYISVQPESGSFSTDDPVPQLKIEIWDWVPREGELTYQWFSFEDIDEFRTNGKGDIITGATDTAYTPGISPEAGKTYYFYVVVTNTNEEALGDAKIASIQSEVAALAFSAPGEPLIPIISRNPADASYRWGSDLNGLKVEARLAKKAGAETAEGTLTYQWYYNGENSAASDGTPVSGENKASFIPGYDILLMGKNYFYVEITNTVGAKTAKAVSIPALITMEPGLRAAPPRITKQPADRLFFNASEITALTVKAESPDLGAVSFQWYSNTSALNKDGTALGSIDTPERGSDGVYTSTYTPAVAGFYYAVAINTNNNVSGDKTAQLASKAVQVRIAAAGAPSSNLNIKIPDPTVPANLKQYIRGYGGMHVAWDSFPQLDKEDTELMYNPDKMGYNILRIMIRPDNIDIRKTMEDMVAQAKYRDYYENVKIVNKYGGYVAASPWTPPKEWKSNNSINGGGNLIPGYYRLFANYLRTFAQLMYDQGAPIYCISISNEPNYVAGYDGCEWSGEEMRDFWLEVGHFTDGVRGYGGGRDLPYVLTMNGESANTPYINLLALQNPKSRAVIDVLARHIYGSRTDSLWNNTAYNPALLKRPDGTMTEVWMTEHNINSANATGYYNDSTWNYVWRYLNDVDLVIRINNENAFVWWASKRFYSMVGDGQFGTTEHAPLPRGWALSHYAHYTIDTTRIGFPMTGAVTGNLIKQDRSDAPIGTYIERPLASVILNNSTDDMDNISARVTAFVSRDGNEISMVMWTPTQTSGSGGYGMGTVKIDLPDGFLVGGVKAHKSWGDDEDKIFQPFDDVTVSTDRKSAYVSVGRGEILSVKFTRQ